MRYRDYLDEQALKQYASAMNSRAAAAGVSGRVDAVMLRSLILDSAGRCGWCGETLVESEFEIDHVLSIMRGGPNRADNLAITCPDCNRRKSGKHPATFAQEIVARGGALSPLIRRILDQYGLDGAARQHSLFDDSSAQTTAASIPPDDETEDIPPYQW